MAFPSTEDRAHWRADMDRWHGDADFVAKSAPAWEGLRPQLPGSRPGRPLEPQAAPEATRAALLAFRKAEAELLSQLAAAVESSQVSWEEDFEESGQQGAARVSEALEQLQGFKLNPDGAGNDLVFMAIQRYCEAAGESKAESKVGDGYDYDVRSKVEDLHSSCEPEGEPVGPFHSQVKQAADPEDEDPADLDKRWLPEADPDDGFLYTRPDLQHQDCELGIGDCEGQACLAFVEDAHDEAVTSQDSPESWHSWMGWLFGQPRFCDSIAGAQVVRARRPERSERSEESVSANEALPLFEMPANPVKPIVADESRHSQNFPQSVAFPFAVMTSHGPLGIPQNKIQRAHNKSAPMSAIRELPHQFSSATFDDLEMSDQDDNASVDGFTKSATAAAAVAAAAVASHGLPDVSVLGVSLLEDHGIHARDGGSIGFRPGFVGQHSRDVMVLIMEVCLPRTPDSSQQRRLNAALRAQLIPREDVAAPLGAVAALARPGAVWAAWRMPSFEAVAGGRPLSDVLSAGRGFEGRSVEWRLAVARQVTSALVGLHAAGRNHGSLSPSFLWVSPGGQVCLLGAGLVDGLLSSGALGETDLLGCLGLDFARYVAPEGWQVPRQAGCPADIWALGLVLLELLGPALPPPHPECTSLKQLSAKVLPGRRHKPRLPPDLPSSLRELVEVCLSTVPCNRPSAQAVLCRLASPGIVQDTKHGLDMDTGNKAITCQLPTPLRRRA